MPRGRKLNDNPEDKSNPLFKEMWKRMNSEKPNSQLMEIKDKKDRIAGNILECMSGSTWQEMMDQLDFVKDFLMTRIVMTRVRYDGYLERQKKSTETPAEQENDKAEISGQTAAVVETMAGQAGSAPTEL